MENLKFDRKTLRYLQRTSEEEEQIIATLQPTDAEDLRYLKKELESRDWPQTKWAPYTPTESRKKVKFIISSIVSKLVL